MSARKPRSRLSRQSFMASSKSAYASSANSFGVSRRRPSRCREDVPTTQLASPSASASVPTVRGAARRSSACTAMRRAVTHSSVTGATRVSRVRPQPFIARAAAPRFWGFRVRTRTR